MIAYLKRVYEAWVDYPWPAGKVLQGRFRIDAFLGMGSYGLTYLCRDLTTGKEVVAKQAKPSKGALGRELLQREKAIMNALEHPAIPQAYTLLESAQHHVLILEYRKGRTVEDLIFDRGAAYGEKEALRLLRRILDIVAYLHAQGIVHLDIRIPNVILGGERISLIDFGLAARLGEPARLTAEADEELIRRRTVDATSDLYAMGHFLLFMLYSTFEAGTGVRRKVDSRAASGQESGSAAGWEEELPLSPETKGMLRKLLGLDAPYPSAASLMEELDARLGA